MMNCQQFRESLDCYLDGELSAAASAAADAHRKECPRCDRAVLHLQELKAAVRRTVGVATPPPHLAARVRAAVATPWVRSFNTMVSFEPRRSALALAAAAVFILAVTVGIRSPIDISAANAMDRLALRLDDSSPVVLEGQILCRDCELEHRYGVKASCKVIGHHGAIATADGRIWNIVEQRTSAALIHDESLLGKSVVVRGRLFRNSRALVIESYHVGS
jgi:putative zinc finger protein